MNAGKITVFEWFVAWVVMTVAQLVLLLFVICVLDNIRYIAILVFASPLLGAVWATLFLRWVHARRYRPGYCGRCGYNLAGNVTGVCPECGMLIRS